MLVEQLFFHDPDNNMIEVRLDAMGPRQWHLRANGILPGRHMAGHELLLVHSCMAWRRAPGSMAEASCQQLPLAHPPPPCSPAPPPFSLHPPALPRSATVTACRLSLWSSGAAAKASQRAQRTMTKP